jgi:probable DNA repair protein
MIEASDAARSGESGQDGDWLLDAIDAGTSIVTANRRLARELSRRYADEQVRRGRDAWLTPAIVYWRDWLQRVLDASAEPGNYPQPLDRRSASLLWEQCLTRRLPDGMPGLAGIVRQAEQAWQRVIDWQVPLDEVRLTARSQDERLFAAAAFDYGKALSERRRVDSAQLALAVLDLLRSEPEIAGDSLLFAGFDRLSPLATKVIRTLEDHGTRVTVMALEPARAQVAVASFESEREELRAAGAWARDLLSANSSARIGIVCPGLESASEQTGRLIREGLAPGWQLAGTGNADPVNLSYGRRLSEYPTIAIALLALRWIGQGMPGREVSILLRSRGFATGDAGARSRLELRLRRFPDRAWTAQSLLTAIGGTPEVGEAAPLVAFLKTVAAYSEADEQRESPVACARRVDEFLAAIGWPGEESLDSAGFQLLNRWRELLNEFARVISVQPSMRLSEAIARISSMAGDSIWQPDGDSGPVQVLGLLEAAGLEFDHLWISGMDASQWPPPASPMPFLSNALQKTYGMPDGSPDQALEDAWALMQRLLGTADHTVVSWVRVRDNSELTPSPLLDRLDATGYEGPGDPGWTIRAAAGTATMEAVADDGAPAVGPDEQVRGGAYTVQNQYVEPFRAFAEGRLGIRRPDAFYCGLSPGQRGDIVHNALHNLLADKPDQRRLADWHAEDRMRRAGAAIDRALAPHQRATDAVLNRLISIERVRLQRILQSFIDSELERPPFAVESLEEAVRLERYGVRLGLRVDRIDRLDDGRIVIIDYKTGQPGHFRNRENRLTEVQLVVYAEAVDADVGALAYVHLDSRAIRWFGAGAGQGDDEDDWQASLANWRGEVDEALRALAEGDARINVLQTTADSRPLAILSRAEECKRGR